MARFVFVVCLVIAGALALAPPVRAQSASATLSGSIVDNSGAVVPDVSVTVLSVATRTERRATTGREGLFTVPALPPGRYVVRATREGFAPAQVDSVVLNVGDQLALTIQLEVGKVGESVTVAGEGVRTSPAVSTVIDRNLVENMPLNGRSFQSLLLLTPGVTMVTSSGLGQFSVNGQRTNANYFTVDGVAANLGATTGLWRGGESNQYEAGTLPGLTAVGGTQNLVSTDALEELKVQTSTYAAEFGRQPGGQVQLVTRSGTSQIRGSLFDSIRNETFDANDWFNNRDGLPKGEFRQQLFGGSLGGPVFLPYVGPGGPGWWSGKERTFFFVSYEALRLRVPGTVVANVPSLRLREAAAPELRRILNGFPLPTGPERLDESGQPVGFAPLTLSYSHPNSHDATSVRIDHSLSRAFKVFGRYSHTPSENGGRSLNKVIESVTTTKILTMGAMFAASPRVTNELRVNYSTSHGQFRETLDDFGGAVPVDSASLATAYSGVGRREGNLQFGWSGFSAELELVDNSKSWQRQVNIVDTLSLVLGSHFVKLGVDYRMLAPSYEPTDHRQFGYFESEAAVRTGILDSAWIASYASVHPRFHNLSAYAQDSWKLRPRLTLDLGLRWEFNPPPDEARGVEPLVVQGVTGTADVERAALAPPGTALYKTYRTAFAPRVGAAWQLSRTPGRETVLRGGLGLFFDLGNGLATSVFNSYPYSTSVSVSNTPYPLPPGVVVLPPRRGVALPIQHELPVMNQDLALPYTLQWNLSMERSLGAQQTLTASYVAAAGRRLLMSQALNYGAGGVRPNPNFADLTLVSNGPTSDYHALQLRFQRRLSAGLQAQIGYTWSHAIDEVSAELSVWGLSRGSADFDVRHNFSAAVTADLPAPAARPLRAVFGGWSVDTIVHAQSGAPLDVAAGSFVGPGGSYRYVRPDLVPGIPLYVDDPSVPGGRRFNAAAFQAPPTDPATGTPLRPGNFGRNVLRGLPLHQVDLALRRQFNLGSSARLQLRLDAFNLFNLPNFSGYSLSAQYAETFGVPTQMLNRSLGGLNPLYQIGGPRSLQFTVKTLF